MRLAKLSETQKRDPMTKRIKDTIVASRIIESVCDSAGIEPKEMLSYTRKWRVSYPRFAAMILIRRHTFMSLHDIGKIFKINHANVCYALRKLATSKPGDRMAATYEAAEQALIQRNENL